MVGGLARFSGFKVGFDISCGLIGERFSSTIVSSKLPLLYPVAIEI